MKRLLTWLFLTTMFAAIPVLRSREKRTQERRVAQVGDFLHRKIDISTDDFRVVGAFHAQDALCLVYVDHSVDLTYAVLPDRSNLVTWDLNEDSKEWNEHCVGAGYRERDLLSFVREEDR
jgi:hypothetical protein